MKNTISIIQSSCSFVALLFFFLQISGCSSAPSTIEVALDPSHEISSPDKVTDAKVGIYYAPNFADYVHKQSFSDNVATVYAGKESVELFNAAIPKAFTATQVIDKLPPYDIARTELDGIIEPRLDYVNWRMGFDAKDEFFHVEYTFILYTSKGVPVSIWTIVGEGKSLQHQMEDVARKFVAKFNDAPETERFRSYLKDKDVGVIGFSVNDIVVTAELVEDNPLGLQLKDSGILPIRVKVTNNTGTSVTGRGFDARLIFSNGKRLAPAFPLAVVSATEYMAALTASDPAVIGGLLGPLAMIPTMAGQSSGRLEDRKTHSEYFEKARLKEITLQNGESIEGNIYFTVPDDVTKLDDATLSIWFIDPSVANGERKEVMLHGLGYVKLSPEELAQKAKERQTQMEVEQPKDEFE